jgi:hypothetical protein
MARDSVRVWIPLSLKRDPLFFIDRFGKEDPLLLQMGPAACRASRTWEPINELRMVARWKLGRALTKVERGQSAGSDPTSSDEQTKFATRASR